MTRLLFATAALFLAPPLAALAQSTNDGGAPPEQGNSHRHRGPPPEAIAACQGKAVGTQASFTDHEGGTITGACTQMGDVVAVAMPRRAHGEHDGPPPGK